MLEKHISECCKSYRGDGYLTTLFFPDFSECKNWLDVRDFIYGKCCENV